MTRHLVIEKSRSNMSLSKFMEVTLLRSKARKAAERNSNTINVTEFEPNNATFSEVVFGGNQIGMSIFGKVRFEGPAVYYPNDVPVIWIPGYENRDKAPSRLRLPEIVVQSLQFSSGTVFGRQRLFSEISLRMLSNDLKAEIVLSVEPLVQNYGTSTFPTRVIQWLNYKNPCEGCTWKLDGYQEENSLYFIELYYRVRVYPDVDAKQFPRDDLLLALDTGDMADMTIKCPDGQLAAHQFVLSLTSGFFRSMFNSTNKESLSGVVDIPNFNIDTIKTLVRFLYSNQIDPEQITPDLLMAADEFMVKELKSICAEGLSRMVDITNVIEYLILSSRHEADRLKEATYEFVVANIDEVQELPEWKDMSKTNPEIIASLFVELATKFNEFIVSK